MSGQNIAKTTGEVAHLKRRVLELEAVLRGVQIEKQNLEKALRWEQAQRLELRESVANLDRAYSELFESTGDALVLHDPISGQIINCNNRASELYGYEIGHLQGKTVKLISGDNPFYSDHYALELIQKADKEGHARVNWLCKDSRDQNFWVEVNLRPINMHNRRAVIAIVRDITEKVQYKDRLSKLEEEHISLSQTASLYRRLKFIADSVPQIIWVADPQGRLTYCNQRFLEVTNLDNSTFEHWIDLVHPEDSSAFRRKWMKALASGITFEEEFRLSRHQLLPQKDMDNYRWYLARAVARRSDAGEIVEWYGTFTEWVRKLV